MKRSLAAIALAAAIILFSTAPASATHNMRMIHFTGNLGNSIYDGNMEMTFRLYDSPYLGNLLWEETAVVLMKEGLFEHYLGSVAALPTGLDFSQQYWVEIYKSKAGIVSLYKGLLYSGILDASAYSFFAEKAANSGDADTLDGFHAEYFTPLADHEALSQRHDDEMAQMNGKHDVDISNLTNQHNADIATVTNQHNADISNLTNQHNSDITNLTNKHDTEMTAMNTKHDTDITNLTNKHDADLAAMKTQSDADYVNVIGDTMSGALNLPANGLVAGTDQMVLANGNVGLRTTGPEAQLKLAPGGTPGPAVVQPGVAFDGADVNGHARMELKSNGGTPYIDFSNGLPDDYDMRIRLTGDDMLSFEGGSVAGNGSGLTNLNGSSIATGTVADARIAGTIARDSELQTSQSQLQSNIDALTLKHNADIAALTTQHVVDITNLTNKHVSELAAMKTQSDTDYVNVTGDTMTGALNLPSNGLVAGGTQLVLSGGHVGIGTSPADGAFLHVKGLGTYGVGDGTDYHNHVALFENTGGYDADGIAIKINNYPTDSRNNFITFYNAADQVVGRVEGFDCGPDYDPTNVSTCADFEMPPDASGVDWFGLITLDPGVSFAGGSVTGGSFSTGSLSGGSFSPGSLPSLSIGFDWTSGLSWDWDNGSLPSITWPSFNPPSISWPTITLPQVSFSAPSIGFDPTPLAFYVDSLVGWAFENDMMGVLSPDPFTIASAPLLLTATTKYQNGGISYASKGADYAEWMQKADSEEFILPGHILGVKGGKVSKNTEGAEQIMAASTAPVVLGNIPPVGHEKDYIRVGFMGRLPVLVFGPVRMGDYIVPSGRNDGSGVAIAPEDIRLKDLPMVLGRAWSESDNDSWFNVIDVAIGVKSNEWVSVLEKQEAEIDSLKAELADIKAMLTK